MTIPLLEVDRLEKVYLRTHASTGSTTRVHAVRSVSFRLQASEVLCLVGESGSGKSTVGKMLADVVPPSSGTIRLNGQDLLALTGRARDQASLRIQLIHQDPFAALNPTRTVAQSMSAPLVIHRHMRAKGTRMARLAELIGAVGLSPAAEILAKYPHQLSGGQRQRVVIARALTVDPEVIVADEATSMVDVSLRVGILETLRRLGDTLGVGFVFITHDFGVARYFGFRQRLAVMYLGAFVEFGPTEAIVANPLHPYTVMLLSAVPLPDPRKNRTRQRLRPLSEDMSDAADIPAGCTFAPRCPFATDRCQAERPPLIAVGDGHEVACHHVERVAEETRSYRTWA